MDEDELTDDYGNVIEPQEAAVTSPLAVEGGDDLERRLMEHHTRIAQMRQRQFEQAQQQLLQQRMGPSLSERLYALSAAFAQPTQTRGFSGMMANVAPVLAQGSGAERKAEEERAAKLQELRNKYLEGDIGAEGDVVDTRLELAKLRSKTAGSAQPRYQLSPVTGLPTAVPRHVFRPKTEAEFMALPEGAFFQTEGMTEPVQKVTKGGAGG